MTAYFDEVSRQIMDVDLDGPVSWGAYSEIEDRLVTDVTVCAMWPTFPVDFRRRIHEAVLRYGVNNLPVNAPIVDFEHNTTYRDRLLRMSSDLHDIFHDLCYSAMDCFSDDPRAPLRCAYTAGESEREQLVGLNVP